MVSPRAEGVRRSLDATPKSTAKPRTPLHPTSGDFDAPGRTDFVPRALAWVSPLVARLAKAGVEVQAEPLPDAETHAIALRRPGLGPRAALVLEIDERAIEAALELPTSAPEIEVFRAQLLRASSAERIFGALAHLPEPFSIALAGEEPAPLAGIDVAALQALVGRVIEGGKRLRIGWHLPREIALGGVDEEGAPSLDEQLDAALAALAVPFALLLREDARPPSVRLAQAARLFRHALPVSRRSARTKRTSITVGTRVRVLTGPFEGKEAIIESIDRKGEPSARIRLGLLAARVELRELDPLAGPEIRPVEGSAGPRRPRAGKSGRPALVSSHRRR